MTLDQANKLFIMCFIVPIIFIIYAEWEGMKDLINPVFISLVAGSIGFWIGRKTGDFLTDELIKLNELKKKGILSEDEFNEQKKQLVKTYRLTKK